MARRLKRPRHLQQEGQPVGLDEAGDQSPVKLLDDVPPALGGNDDGNGVQYNLRFLHCRNQTQLAYQDVQGKWRNVAIVSNNQFTQHRELMRRIIFEMAPGQSTVADCSFQVFLPYLSAAHLKARVRQRRNALLQKAWELQDLGFRVQVWRGPGV